MPRSDRSSRSTGADPAHLLRPLPHGAERLGCRRPHHVTVYMVEFGYRGEMLREDALD
jgi:hypothetical protein